MKINSYHDLEVWKKGRLLVKQIYQLTEPFPRSETYGLTSQLRRAVISIPSNVAEGHSRHSTNDFINFISISIGSLAELDTQIILAQDLKYITVNECDSVTKNINELQRMLHALRNSLKKRDAA